MMKYTQEVRVHELGNVSQNPNVGNHIWHSVEVAYYTYFHISVHKC